MIQLCKVTTNLAPFKGSVTIFSENFSENSSENLTTSTSRAELFANLLEESDFQFYTTAFQLTVP